MNPASPLPPSRSSFALRCATWCALALSLTGCVSLHWVRSEKEFSEPPANAAACDYDWQLGQVLFRAGWQPSHGWEPPERRGHGALVAHVTQLTSGCTAPESARRATVSVYTQEHVRSYPDILAISAYLVSLYSLGTVPLPSFRVHAACVHVTSPDGLNRTAVAQGKIWSLDNIWGDGGIGPQAKRGMPQRTSNQLQDLTSQAWTKLWLSPAGTEGTEACQQRLDVLAGREPSKAPQAEAPAADADAHLPPIVPPANP
jgi:hypothetical protein